MHCMVRHEELNKKMFLPFVEIYVDKVNLKNTFKQF